LVVQNRHFDPLAVIIHSVQARTAAAIIFATTATLMTTAAGCWRDTHPTTAVVEPVAPELPSSTLPHVAGGEFGTFDAFSRFTKATVIPNRNGVAYGWRIHVPCKKPQLIDIKETLRMPAPGDWHVDQRTRISADRTTITTSETLPCDDDGWIHHRWFASPGDPDGTYIVTVEVDGYTPVRFRPRFSHP